MLGLLTVTSLSLLLLLLSLEASQPRRRKQSHLLRCFFVCCLACMYLTRLARSVLFINVSTRRQWSTSVRLVKIPFQGDCCRHSWDAFVCYVSARTQALKTLQDEERRFIDRWVTTPPFSFAWYLRCFVSAKTCTLCAFRSISCTFEVHTYYVGSRNVFCPYRTGLGRGLVDTYKTFWICSTLLQVLLLLDIDPLNVHGKSWICTALQVLYCSTIDIDLLPPTRKI